MKILKKIALTVVAVVLGFTVLSPGTAKAMEIEDTQRIRDNFKQYLVGDVQTNNLGIAKAKADALVKAGQAAINEYEITDVSVFKNIYLVNAEGLTVQTEAQLSQAIQNSFVKLNSIALAYAMEYKDNPLYHDETAKNIVLEGIQYLYENFYQDQDAGYYGNWYNWEIGVPLSFTKILLLMEDEINEANQSFIKDVVKSMDLYLRNGIDGDVDLSYRNYTGANLFDVTFNRIIHGALLEDEARISKAFSDMMTVFKTIDPDHIVNGVTDGYYEDGSILQHSSVAYTGSYGAVLLERIGQTVTVLTGTQWQSKELLDTVQLWIYTAFSPIIYEGYMMEIVKGRAVSRNSTGYVSNRSIIEAFVELSQGLLGEEKDVLLAHIKYIAQSSPNPVGQSSFKSLQNIIHFDELMKDDSIVGKNAIESEAHFAFNLMDKTVHLRDEFAFSISKSSSRVSKYEYMSGENQKSWFQGDGMFSLYLSGKDHNKSYGVDFFASVDPYKLPGTTTPNEERKTILELYGAHFFTDLDYDMFSSSVKQNEYVYFPLGTNDYSGGVTYGKYGVSSMQLGDEPSYLAKENGELPENFVTYRNADANKSWFMFDDQIVVLGSNITDKFNRTLTSTYDNRMYDENDNLTLDVYSNSLTISSEKEDSDISYVFLDGNNRVVEESTRTGDHKEIRDPSPTTKVTKKYVTVTTEHDGKEVSDYSYIILPNANSAARYEFEQNNPIDVLANTSDMHAVSHAELGLKAYASFSSNKVSVEDLSTLDQMMIMRDGNTFSVTDPTNKQEEVSFELKGRYTTNQAGVSAAVLNGVTTFTINTKSLNGKSVVFDATPASTPQPNLLQAAGVSVSYLDGQLPEGVVLEVFALEDFKVNAYDVKSALNIRFFVDGKEVQPIGDVGVSIDDKTRTLSRYELLRVDNDTVDVLAYTNTESGIEFKTDRGAVYAYAEKVKDPVKPGESNDKENLPATGSAVKSVAPYAMALLGAGLILSYKANKKENE